ncbi:MAG: hypothetical protein WCK73_11130 [Deltaproteobacteria bacterium]
MLDAFIIEEIRRREREGARDDRPAIQIPVPGPEVPPDDEDPSEKPPRSGNVIIIDYG